MWQIETIVKLNTYTGDGGKLQDLLRKDYEGIRATKQNVLVMLFARYEDDE